MNTLHQITNAMQMVRPGAPIYTGKPGQDDLNWAMQQVRANGKPAGDKPEMNQLAADMLTRWIPSMSAEDAGEHVRMIHGLSYQLEQELIQVLTAAGYSAMDATYCARRVAYHIPGTYDD